MHMTEKVKLTQEQIEVVRRFMNNNYILKLSVNELHKVIDGFYELKETFKVGDWVTSVSGATCQITKIRGDEIWGQWSKITVTENYIKKVNVRHATPEEITEEKQRIWWNRNNRKTWELHVGDTLISRKNPYSCRIKFVEDVNENSVLLVDGIQDEFYEGVSELEYMRDEYEVFCFKEDRKDSVK